MTVVGVALMVVALLMLAPSHIDRHRRRSTR